MAFLEAKNLTKRYSDGTEALRGASLSVEEGEFLAVMGPSGSGKSTLLHILGFLDRQTGGEYSFNHRQFSEMTDDEVAYARNEEMGFVFQMFNLLPKTSVLDNVKLPLVYSGIPKAMWDNMALSAIESVGLSHRLNSLSSTLSGGEKQRVAIARALVRKPKIIFADEPTGNLDTKSGQSIMEIFEKLNKDLGHTIVLITHETTTAEHAERIIHIKDGLIEKDEKVMTRRSASLFIK
ncbi:MAG: ABC transporter ATP-binding protein [Patescibacteria group bacterium]